MNVSMARKPMRNESMISCQELLQEFSGIYVQIDGALTEWNL